METAATERAPDGPSAKGAPPMMDSPEVSDSAADLARNLERALEREQWQELRVETECLQNDAFRHVLIFGNGVAIWNERRQMSLGHGDLVAILEALRDADFPSMLELYGRGQEEPTEKPEEGAVIRITCRVALTLDGVSRQAAQRARGPQFAPLKALAEEILALAHKPEAQSVTAADLSDGLAKMADGRLAPEAMTLVLNRKEEDVEAGTLAEPRDAGYLLRVDGRLLSVRPFRKPGGYGEPVETELDAATLAELAELLESNGVGDLPPNLYAGHYSDLVVVVLDQDVRIQARRFANMTPRTHGEKQQRFDRIEKGLDELARRILSDHP
jgi:hypothetical protein